LPLLKFQPSYEVVLCDYNMLIFVVFDLIKNRVNHPNIISSLH